MNDPRSENARQFTTNNGMVTGVELAHIPVAGSKWELVQVALIDEASAQGNTVARVLVRDKEGIDSQVNCYLAWPWKGWHAPSPLENKQLPGSANYPYEHVISNGYNDAQGNVISDVIGGLGLPHNHHVSYHLVFRERGTIDPNTHPETDPGGDITERLQRIEEKLNRLAAHFGVP